MTEDADPGAVTRAVLCLALGATAWVLLVAIPGRDDSNVNGAPYLVALVAVGAFVGATFGGQPFVTGALLIAPALLTAGWLAPRGDDDGLWVLIYPVVVFDGFAAAGAQWLTVATIRRRRG